MPVEVLDKITNPIHRLINLVPRVLSLLRESRERTLGTRLPFDQPFFLKNLSADQILYQDPACIFFVTFGPC